MKEGFIMKIPAVEKVVIIIIIISFFIMFIGTCYCNKMVNKAGGARQVIVDIGKEIKSISNDIQKQ